MRKIEKIAIAGSGKMGKSIFNFLSNYRISIKWYSRNESEKNQKKYHSKLKRSLKNNIISEEEYEFKMKNHVFCSSVYEITDIDLVVETISEDIGAKKELIAQLFSVISDYAVVASNTSSFYPAFLSENPEFKKRIVGIHFFYPVELKSICELIVTEYNTEIVEAMAESFLSQTNRTYLKQNSENAFLLNRLALVFQAKTYNFALENKITFAEIDSVYKSSFSHVGIFEMMNIIGLKTIYTAAKSYLNNNIDQIYGGIFEFLEKREKQSDHEQELSKAFYENSININEINAEKVSQINEFILNAFNETYTDFFDFCKKNNCDSSIFINEYFDTEIKKWPKI